MAYENDILTRNDNDELAVRTVQSTGDNPASSYDDVYTRDNNGKLAVRIVGSGGGGDVDTTKVVNKAAVLPTSDSSNVGKVYMYSGETDATYTHGYIYECQATTVYEDTTTFQPATISGTVVTATSGALANLCAEYITGDITEIVSGTMTYDNSSDLWVFVGKDSEDNTVGTFQVYQLDYEDAGFTFTGTPVDGDVVSFVTEITATSTYSWVRIDVQPAGSSDEHNLGWYATQSALETAHPTANDGDWAIVGSTDTVWVWDSDTTAWKDTDQKGQVTSVNNMTGAVTLGINDVAPTQTGKSGYVLGTDGFVAGWVRPEIVQRSALPQASEEEVGKIYQYVGATDANYTNGYFYKCVSDGGNPATYSWENIEVQEADALPSQTGQSGKFLTTNGTSVSWGEATLVTFRTWGANE